MRILALGASLFFAFTVIQAQAAIPGATTEKYKDVQALMKSLVEKYPQNVRSFTLGVSDKGVPIEGVEIGQGPVNHLVVGTHHGNEYGSTEVAKGFMIDLASHPIQGQRIYIVPVLNTSGYDARNRYESGAGSQTYDSNRDYPGPCGPSKGFNLKSTAALAKFLVDKNIVAAATLHTYSPAVVYPWGFSTPDLSTPYDTLFTNLCKAATVESGYAVGNSAEVIYPANGTFEDYAFWKNGVWSILFELGGSHYPNEAALKEMVRVNTPGLRRMFEQAPTERAEKHAFTGKCDYRLMSLDRHDE